MPVTFPRIYTRPDHDRLIAACRGIDGSQLVETFFALQHDTGLRTWDITMTPEFRLAFVAMLDEARDKAKCLVG